MEFPERFRTRRLLLTRIGRSDLDDLIRMRSDRPLGQVLGSMRPDNVAAGRVMAETGFAYERDLVHAGEPRMLYRLTADAWRIAPVSRPASQVHGAVELQAI